MNHAAELRQKDNEPMKTLLVLVAILASGCGGAACPILEDPAMVERGEAIRAEACAAVAALPDVCPAVEIAKASCEASASAFVVLTRLREAEQAVAALQRVASQ